MARITELLASGRTFSFEFFPPKTDAAQLSLGRTIAELETLHPSFVSVTYGAGGSTRERTRDLVTWMRRETTISPVAHLTCVGHTRGDIEEILQAYVDAGVENILALGGDPPTDPADVRPSDYRFASDLVHELQDAGKFSIGVAAHPEVHPRSSSRTEDREFLVQKLRLADFAITQFFFDNADYLHFRDRCAAAGISVSIVPGILPITRFGQVARFAARCGAKVPNWLAERFAGLEDDADTRRMIAASVAIEQVSALQREGVEEFHFYTLNRAELTYAICHALGLRAEASA